jgi:hypothetical protein
MGILRWDNPEEAWKKAQHLSDPECWQVYENGLEFEDSAYRDCIVKNTGSTEDLEDLRFWQKDYQKMVDSLTALIIQLNAGQQANEHPEAARIVLEMRRYYKAIVDEISKTIDNTERRNECTKRELQAIASAPEASASTAPAAPVLSSGYLAPPSPLPSKDGISGNSAGCTSELTIDDLIGDEFTTSELAKLLKKNASNIRRRAEKAAERMGWDSNSKVPLAVDHLFIEAGNKERRFAAISHGTGGKGKGWVFKEINSKSEPNADDC